MMSTGGEELVMYPRDWVCHGESSSDRDTFSVVTYNILSDAFIHEGHYQYCPPDKRYLQSRHKHIMVEMETMKPDIVCYQEVQQHHWENHLLPDMRSLGFDGVHTQLRNDSGLAIFFRVGVFSLQEHTCKLFHEILDDCINDSKLGEETERSLKKYINLPLGTLLARLHHVKTGKQLHLAVVHIIWASLLSPELQTMQIIAATKGLKAFLEDEKNSPYIICGDFNTPPYFPGYSLLADGRMDERMILRLKQLSFTGNEPVRHGLSRCLVDYLPALFAHDLDLVSAYQTVLGEEPHITNADDHSHNQVLGLCLDYIWFSQRSLDVRGVLQLPSCDAILKHDGLPSVSFPSDHLPLQAGFEFK